MRYRDFVTAEYEIIWKALQSRRLSHAYVSILRRMCKLAAREAVAFGRDGTRWFIPGQTAIDVSVSRLLNAHSMAREAQIGRNVLTTTSLWDV